MAVEDGDGVGVEKAYGEGVDIVTVAVGAPGSDREVEPGTAPVNSKAAAIPARKLRAGISIHALPTLGPPIRSFLPGW